MYNTMSGSICIKQGMEADSCHIYHLIFHHLMAHSCMCGPSPLKRMEANVQVPFVGLQRNHRVSSPIGRTCTKATLVVSGSHVLLSNHPVCKDCVEQSQVMHWHISVRENETCVTAESNGEV